MSEVRKPAEEIPVVASAVEPATDATAAAAATAATAASPTETPTQTPAPAADTAVAAEEPAKEEVKPATDGVLGHKSPGLVKGFRFSKRFFWFSDDAVEVRQLTTYFQNEKLSIAHPTAAWASQTGKGLLFYAKRAEDKATPTGIVNLADISDIVKESGHEFQFKVAGHKHVFQAGSDDERASWIAALEAKAAEAKREKETVTSSEGYKAELEKLTKPPVVAAAAPKKSLEKKEPAKAEEGEERKEEEKKPEQKEKSRSQSRKRASIFGSFLGKKEEEKKEEKLEGKEEPEVVAPAVETSAPVAEAAETPVPTPAAEEPKAEEKKPEAKPESPTAGKTKRASIFGNIFHKVSNQDKIEKDSAVKSTETPVSSTAPQLGDPVDASTSEPTKPETVTAAAEPSQPAKEGEEPVASPTSAKNSFLNFIKKHDDKKEIKANDKVEKKSEEALEASAVEATTSPATKDKRRTSLFGTLGKKEKKPEGTSDGEQAGDEEAKSKSSASSPLPKLGGVFHRVSKPSKKDKETAPAATPSESEPIPEGAEKPEPVSKDSPAEPTAAVNGSEAPEEIKDDAAAVPAASSSQPVQAAA
ncbi:hypothetical protein PAAG_03092 [Paracoccidioides lutzii Pb01]|uniref:PH domain-containing protein n=1 Tax=Paracoccidioides lutzii (strain ATCC MYA-826 / Pb01) TaxID=502779 RepID=C1GYD8_PARBA|nr:hypothetical protein PAAG_03092 [Paracoccidioides lutzii Pb01]EEH41528.1 hypothetical protein PAAG_03092 [Paracoccidioides lutzii Pb01]